MRFPLPSRRRPSVVPFRSVALFVASTVVLSLAGCGGGGGGGGGSAPAAPAASTAPASTAATGSSSGSTTAASGGVAAATGSGSTSAPTTGSGASTCATAAGACSGADGGSVAKAVVQVVPVLTAQPQSISVTSGQAASFAVAATSESTPTYQWSRNGTAINGANATTYTIAATQLADSGARFTVAVTNPAGTTTSAAAILTVDAAMASAQSASAARPFSDQSPWNARPTAVTLGTYEVPKSYYFPTVAEGAYSVGVFTASNNDPPVSVKGPNASTGVYVADAEAWVDQVTIPHWPANLRPATGSDGHADIVDVAANRIHSFYALTSDNGTWRAQQYTWTPLNGRGFGTPGQYFQGSRAAGVVPMAGLIRTVEIDDGLPSYRHALAMSMTFNALAADPAYAFPATAADVNAASLNSGRIPEGALMMLPADFDLSAIKDRRLLKVAKTLQTYGAYVVDANSGTPFVIYAEIGSGYQLMPNGWDGEVASELDQLRAALRQVVSATAWVDANGVPFTPEKNFNLLSMRGGWYVLQGGAAGVFDTWEQAVTFPDNGVYTRQINASGRSMPPCNWAMPEAGRSYRYTVKASGGASVQLDIVDGNLQIAYTTGALKDGQSVVFAWPPTGRTGWLTTASGPSGGGKVAATLVAL